MQFKDGSKLRRYIFMQQLLIGIVQLLLAVALLKGQHWYNTSISIVTGSLNFGLSTILFTYFGVDLYPTGVSPKERIAQSNSRTLSKQTKALLTIALGFVVNFIALSVVLKTNQDDDLTSILTWSAVGTAAKAFAVFFYTTLYVTLLMGIGFATYFLIDISDEGELPKIEREDFDEGPRISYANQRRNHTVMKDPQQMELEEVCVPNQKGHARRTHRNHSQASEMSTHMPLRNVDFDTRRQSFRKSSIPRDIPVRPYRLEQRPPTPPPLPPPSFSHFAVQSAKRQAETARFNDQLLERIGRRYRRSSE